MTALAQIKGGIIRARLDFVRAHGADKLDQVLHRLPEADQHMLHSLILAVSWYPFELGQRLDHAIADVLAGGDAKQIYLEMGRSSAEANLKGMHKAFFHADDPHYVLERSPQVYAQYYDRGRRAYERTGDHSGILRTFDAERVTLDDCLTVVGWYERAIEISGGTEVQVKDKLCRALGDPHCEYWCNWR